MAVKKKKKKKKSFSSSGVGSSREMSPLRPRHVEKKPPCHGTCPSGNRIREFITTIARAEKLGKSMDEALEQAWGVYTDTSPFPAVCGRVCPAPCETACNRKELEGAVGINKIERAIGDFGVEKGLKLKALSDEKKPQKVAVVGAGPGGLSCAYQLARRGYGVTVFEELGKGGGMLRWGIPSYRLPESILDAEIQKIVDVGVEIKYGVKVGKDLSLDELKKSYDGVFVALGAQLGVKLRVEGEDASNVLSGVEFLSRFHHGEKLDIGDDVIIIGGGDTAIDAARICKRLGATVTILYRRTRKEMPAIEEEIDEALAEGVKIEYLAAPVGFKKDGDRIVAMQAIRMELGEPDASGRRRPVPIEGSQYEIPATAVIPAVSQQPDFTGFESLIEGRDWIKVDANGLTKVEGIWAGGDVVDLALVTTAVGHGRRAAEAIDRLFTGGVAEEDKRGPVGPDRMLFEHYEKSERGTPKSIPVEERMKGMEIECNLGLSSEDMLAESRRCMSCGYCVDCEKCWMYCQDQAIERPREKGGLYPFKLENCTGCKKCSEICPCGFIDMV